MDASRTKCYNHFGIDYNLVLILTGMNLGLLGQFYNNMNVVSLGLVVFLYSLYRMYIKPR